MPHARAFDAAPEAREVGSTDFKIGGGLSTAAVSVQGAVYGGITFAALYAIALVFGQPFEAPYQVVGILAALLSFLSMNRIDLLAPWRVGQRGSPGTQMVIAWTRVVALLLLVGYAVQYSGYFSRKVLLLWVVFAPMGLVAANLGLRWGLSRSMPELSASRKAVLVFVNDTTRDFAQRLKESNNYDVLGYFDDRDLNRIQGGVAGIAHLGHSSILAEYVRTHDVGVVFIVLPVSGSHRAVGLFEALGDTTASVFYVPDFGVFDQFQARVIEVESMPVLEIIETPIYGVDGLIKQLFDKAFSVAALLFAGLPMLIIALLIKLDSTGPVLFKQRRYGLNGREFQVLKFRTMYTGSERVADTRQATREDPRITPIGRFLRRTSLDELPQFINVLLGDMSVVGPRPHTVAHNEYYRKEIKRYMSRHKVKPGVTGLSQVRGLRGETAEVESMAERIRMDIEYIRTWSLMLDIGIILQTVVKVFKDRNAY